MSEDNQPESDAREPWEKLSQIVDPEFKRQGDEWLKRKQEALAANGYKPFPPEEGNYEVDIEQVRRALNKANESPIQLDPFDYDEYW